MTPGTDRRHFLEMAMCGTLSACAAGRAYRVKHPGRRATSKSRRQSRSSMSSSATHGAYRRAGHGGRGGAGGSEGLRERLWHPAGRHPRRSMPIPCSSLRRYRSLSAARSWHARSDSAGPVGHARAIEASLVRAYDARATDESRSRTCIRIVPACPTMQATGSRTWATTGDRFRASAPSTARSVPQQLLYTNFGLTAGAEAVCARWARLGYAVRTELYHRSA